jgi:proline iminopeptidase
MTEASAVDADERYVPGAKKVRLHYRVLGTGRPVVVVHNKPNGSMRNLIPDLEPLSAGHRVIFYDQQKGGRSSLPVDKSLLGAGYFVEDLEAVRRHFGLSRLTLLAHSFGSVIVGRYMETFPDRVERVILTGAIGPRAADAYAFAMEQSRRLPADVAKRAASVVEQLQSDADVDRVLLCRQYEELERSALPAGAKRPGGTSCDEPKKAVDYSMRYTSRITFESFGSWDYSRSLKNVVAPLLVIYGDKDPSPPASQEAWAAALSQGRLLVVPGAGHNPHVDRPEAVFPAIESFLSGAWPDGAGFPRSPHP